MRKKIPPLELEVAPRVKAAVKVLEAQETAEASQLHVEVQRGTEETEERSLEPEVPESGGCGY